MHARCSVGATVDSKTKCTLKIDDAHHQSHQKHPTGNDIENGMQNKVTYNPSSTDENVEHTDTPSKSTHSKQSINYS